MPVSISSSSLGRLKVCVGLALGWPYAGRTLVMNHGSSLSTGLGWVGWCGGGNRWGDSAGGWDVAASASLVGGIEPPIVSGITNSCASLVALNVLHRKIREFYKMQETKP